ncbi:bromodomain-containing protein 4-like isoform X2 [Stylophora pistillata]|uniref:bromodomain-containing protein 4-like isoform X2 n=1 Tax=Stylophora pistillata TaxID=50429 RepID=UPI000C0510DD|nr:bromodomain-containing protein 4-like isoform X2 [Stylophora pistillata]
MPRPFYRVWQSDNRQTAGQKRQRVGFDSSASESSDSESDGSSDTDTDTDSDTEEEDSGFLNRKPVRAKQKVSKKTTTERRKAGAPIKMNNKEKNGKGSSTTIAKKQRPKATNKRNNNEKKGVSTTNTKKQKPEATNKTNHKEKKASPKKVPMEKAGANKRKNVTKEGRENEDGPKAKKRREALPKQCPLTSEESEESVNTNSIPPYVLARGLVALAAYKRALEKGKTYDRRIKIVLIGQDRSGKTSLRRYLVGETFNEQEPSTDGIEMIPSIKNAETGAWKNPADLKTTSAFHHKFAEVVTEKISSSSKTSAQLFIEERRETQKVTQETPSKLLIHETSELVLSESIGSTQDVKKEQIPEEIPEKVLFLIERGLEGNYTSKNEDIWPIVWDFAGQAVYHAIHPIFLS